MKKLLLMLFLAIFLIGNVGALEFDNTLTYSGNDLKVTFENLWGLPLIGSELGMVELKSHSSVDYVKTVGLGSVVVMWYDFNFVDLYSDGLGEVEFTNVRTGKPTNREHSFVYWGEKERDVYGKGKCYFEINGTQTCEKIIIGKEIYNDWLPYDSKDIPSGNIRIGLLVTTKIRDYTDGIWTIVGKKVNKHAEWNISTAIFIQSGNLPVSPSPRGMFFKDDGTKAFISDTTNQSVDEYSLSIAWDVSTLGFTDSLSVAGTTPQGITFKTDGTKMYIFNFGGGGKVDEYDLSPAWDVSTGLPVGTGDVSEETTQPAGGIFKTDGTKMFVSSQSTGVIIEYALSTAWNVSTISFTQNFSVASREPAPQGMFFNPNGEQMFTIGQALDEVAQYELSDPWNISSALFLSNFSILAQDGGAVDLFIGKGGTKMFMLGAANKDIFEYNLTIVAPAFPTVTLNSPIDTFNSTSQTITFNGTVFDDINLINVSLFIDGNLNETNSSGINNTDYIFTKILSEGNHNWTYEACDDEGQCTTADTRTFSIDSINPSITILAPPTTVSFHILNTNLSVNWSVSDLNLDTCILEFEGVNRTITCLDNSTEISITTILNSTITIHVNDTFGNMNSTSRSWNYDLFIFNQTFSNLTIEGSTEIFKIDYNVNSSKTVSIVNLSYNGTENLGAITSLGGDNFIASETIFIPLVTSNTNITFFWNFTFSDGTFIGIPSNNQTIQNLGLDNCSTNTNLILNYTLRDEESQAILSGSGQNTTMEVSVIIFTADKTTEILSFSTLYNQTNPAEVCLNINLTTEVYQLDAVNKYNSDTREIEYHNLQGFNLTSSSIPQNINLFDLLSVDSTEFQITFKDVNFVVVENALVQINRQYVSEGVFKNVEIPKTDSNGQTVVHLVEKDIVYNIIVTKDTEVIGTFNNIIAFCEDATIGSCFITLNALQTNLPVYDYDTEVGLLFSFSYNETTRILSFPFTTTDGSSKNITLNGLKIDQLGNTSVCSETLVSSSGTLFCTIPPSVGNETIIIKIFIDGDLTLINYISAGTEFDLGEAGYFLMLFLVLSLGLMFIESKTGVIIGVVIGLISSVLLSFIQGGILGFGSSIIWIIIASFVLIFKFNSDNQT